MGMFDKDVMYGGVRLDKAFELGDRFILWGIEVGTEPVPTKVGNATRTTLRVSKLDSPGDEFEVVTLASAIAEKAAGAEEGDFPAVVELEKVPGRYDSDALVISLVEPYKA